jgi:hypothetical protein
MDTKMDLKEMERRAWTTYFQDGIWDMFLGLVLVNMGLGVILYAQWSALPRISASLGVSVIGITLFWIGKRYITIPRLGVVKFGSKRRKNRKHLLLIVLFSVVITFTILIFSMLSNSDILVGFSMPSVNYMGIFISILVGATMIAIAYFNDFLRGYYIAFLFAISILIRELFGITWIFLLNGAFIIIPGIVLFFRFLRKYPKHNQEEYYERTV